MEKTSIERALDVLDLIGEDRPTVSQEFVAESLALTRSTAYRYLKLLCDSGMLVQLSRGRYSLGPRIIELDRKIQMSDPLLAAGRIVMPQRVDALPGERFGSLRVSGETGLSAYIKRKRGSRKERVLLFAGPGVCPSRSSREQRRWRSWPTCPIRGSSRSIFDTRGRLQKRALVQPGLTSASE